jgi:hypothetical protein
LLLDSSKISMIVTQLLESCRKRVPFTVMKAILKLCDLSGGHGWEDTIKKLAPESKFDVQLTSNFNKLDSHYKEHLLVGEKALQLFRVDREKIDKMITFLKNNEIKKNVFHETYPYLLPEEKLKTTKPLPELVEIIDSDNYLSLVFCSKRLFSEKTEIDPESLNDEAKKHLSGYDELFGIRRYERQSFDIVVLWKAREIVEVRIDIVQGIPSQEREQAFVATINGFHKLATNNSDVKVLNTNNINLFPLISHLYDSQEGKVGELAFTTDEGSIKLEKMRRGKVDLRDEIYHKAGRQAVPHITPYKLAILWEFPLAADIKTNPELLLPALSHTLNSSNPILKEAIVTKCSCLKDYGFVFEKNISYLYTSK